MQNAKALSQAKANVERYFKVVGVLENLNETLAVLETHIPRYFNGLQDMYFNELLSKKNRIERGVYISLYFLICHCINCASDKNQTRIDALCAGESAAGIFCILLLYLSVCLLQSRISTKIKIIPGS